jgi:hypothetical protein
MLCRPLHPANNPEESALRSNLYRCAVREAVQIKAGTQPLGTIRTGDSSRILEANEPSDVSRISLFTNCGSMAMPGPTHEFSPQISQHLIIDR